MFYMYIIHYVTSIEICVFLITSNIGNKHTTHVCDNNFFFFFTKCVTFSFTQLSYRVLSTKEILLKKCVCQLKIKNAFFEFQTLLN